MASSMSWEEARDRLKTLRDDQARHSEEVVEIWECILKPFTHKLGNDLWLIYEQVCIAALDCGHQMIAGQCVHALHKQFSDSKRVLRLQGLLYEAEEQFDKAEDLYQKVLEDDPTNSLVRKRLVAINKAQNKIPEAIKVLNDYLKEYMSDGEAWMELCDLYLLELDYAKAAFCMEELIMSNPHSHLYHHKFAEIKYTQGGAENMEIARKYFAQALKLNSNNIRALYGMFLASSNLASGKSSSKSRADNIKYAGWAAKQLAEKYKAKESAGSGEWMGEVEGLLSQLQITSS